MSKAPKIAAGSEKDEASHTYDSPRQKPSPATASKSPQPANDGQLLLCRNKHWRYISAYNGPWLTVDFKILERFANQNYFCTSPRPIHAALLFDLVKIRRLSDVAIDFGVRASTGLSGATLNNSLNAGKNIYGNVSDLGLGYNTRRPSQLSSRTKLQMRQKAVARLSSAYEIDEIGASVVMMQSASPAEDVAEKVLQSDPDSVEAKYVHFFHEKIPSRMVDECTSLEPLNEVIDARPFSSSAYRTRALTRLFKQQWKGAVDDLSEGLRLAEHQNSLHKQGKDQLILASSLEKEYGRDWRETASVKEEDQPSSLTTQMLFHRAGTYLTIACNHVPQALGDFRPKTSHNGAANGDHVPSVTTDHDEALREQQLKARKILKIHANRAIKDYLAFLSELEYCPGYSTEVVTEYLRQVGKRHHSNTHNTNTSTAQLEQVASGNDDDGAETTALVALQWPSIPNGSELEAIPNLQPPKTYRVSELFSSSPAVTASLPEFPSKSSSSLPASFLSLPATFRESLTYHPLLTEALHGLLLSHSLFQTSPKELLRHAHNVARLTRLADGGGIFKPARSPAHVDWIEILRRAKNWIGLEQHWVTLCKPPTYRHSSQHHNGAGRDGAEMMRSEEGTRVKETREQRDKRIKEEAILEALADDRVFDEATFERAVSLRFDRLVEDEEANARSALGSLAIAGPEKPRGEEAIRDSRSSEEQFSDSLLRTERAHAVARWVREAPLTVEGEKKKKKRKKPKSAHSNGAMAHDAAHDDSDEVD